MRGRWWCAVAAVAALGSCVHLPRRDDWLQLTGVRPIAVPQLAHKGEGGFATAVSDDGAVVVTSRANEVFVWDVERGLQVRHEMAGAFALSRDGRTLVLGGDDLRICRLTEVRCVAVHVPLPDNRSAYGERFFEHVGLTPSGRYLWVNLPNDTYIVRIADAAIVHKLADWFFAVADDPGGRFTALRIDLVKDAYQLIAARWSIRDSERFALQKAVGPIAGYRPAIGEAFVAAYSADGDRALVGGTWGAVLAELPAGTAPGRLARLTDRPVDAATFRGDDAVIALSVDRKLVTHDRQARVRSSVAGAVQAMNGDAMFTYSDQVITPRGTRTLAWVTANAAFVASSSPGGDQLILNLGGRAWLWDRLDPRGAVAIELPGGRGAAATFQSDTGLLLAGDELQFQDLAKDAAQRLPDSAGGPLLAVSPDGRRVFRATGGAPGTIGAVWQHPFRDPPIALAVPGAAAEEVRVAAFSTDGRLLVTGAGTGVARAWDASTGQQLARLDHPAALAAVAIAPDGHVVTADTADRDRFRPWPRLWSLPAGAAPRPRLERILGQRLRTTGRGGATLLVDDWVLDNRGRRLWRVPSAAGAAALSADGRRAAVVEDRERIHVAGPGGTIDSIPLDGLSVVDLAFQGPTVLRGTDTEGVLHLWRVCDRDVRCGRGQPRELCRIIATDAGWIAVDAAGRYDTSNFDALGRLAWVMSDDPLRAVPGDLFISDYYAPGLVSRLVASAMPRAMPPRLPPAADLAKLDRSVPRVEIVAVTPADCAVPPCAGPRARVTLDVSIDNKPRAYDLRLFRDGNLVVQAPFGSSPIELDRTGHRRLELDIPLAASRGTAELTAYAFNASRLKGPTARFHYAYSQPAAPSARPRAFVIAIGVGPSGPGLEPLRWAPADALAMVRLLVPALQRDYAVVPIALVSPPDRMAPGCSETRLLPAPSRTTIESVFRALAGAPAADYARREVRVPCGTPDMSGSFAPGTRLAVAPDDVVFVYVSAHGVANTGQFAVVAEGGDRISSSDLSAWMRTLPSDHIVVVFDSCESEAAVAAAGFRPGPLGDASFGQLAYDKAMQILTASGANQDAVDSEQVGGSLLVDSLRTRLDQRRRVTTRELLRSAVYAVPALFRELGIRGHVQQPVLFDYRTHGGDVVLALDP